MDFVGVHTNFKAGGAEISGFCRGLGRGSQAVLVPKLDDCRGLRYYNKVMNAAAAKIRERLQGKKTASPHRIARNSETVWGDARESGDGAQGAARGGIYRRDGRYGEKDGQRAGRIQIDRT